MVYRSVVKRIIALALSLGFVACAANQGNRTRLADGSYHVSCKEPLSQCLASGLRDVCTRYGYDVVHAKEEKKHYGPSLWEAEYISSDAVVRCREPEALVGGKSTPSPGASSAPAPLAAPGARCFPGSTQACLGPGACQGAQTCREDGARFGACDCGGAVTPIPAADAGLAPTPATPLSDGGAP
jgi:hypothetical protein